MEDFIKVSTSIHTIALKIVTFKDEWVTLSDDYKQQVESIDSKLASYREHARLHGLDADSRMMEILKRAEDSLKRAESRLEGLSRSASSNPCYSHIRLWCAKLSILLFPENVEKIVKKGNEDINDFLQVLKDEAEISTQMQLAGRRRAIPTLFYDTDNLYVPIEKVQSAVVKAIEDPEGCQIVLLYGGIGKGKSTLARYMVHLYGNMENQEKGNLFEHVIWVSCSNCTEKDVSTKQLDILQQYSPNSLGDSLPKDTSGPARIAQALKDFPTAKRVLIILDDVSNPSFLREMWKATIGVRAIRYLVTSQQQYICYKAALKQYSLPIFMEDATQDEAMSILASLVGVEAIPDKLQGVAKKIILATDKNPLALACLASHFANNKDNTEERAWQDAYKELHKLLNNTEEKIVLDSSPRKLWAVMKLCISTLDTIDAKKILFMMYECKAESVPEAVLRIWHSRISKCSFLQSRNELQMRELLKPAMNLKDKGQNDGESKAWSLGSLVKHYIEEYMVEEIGPVIGELVGDEEIGPESRTNDYKQVSGPQTAKAEKARVALILCALYFDQSHFYTYETVSKALTRAKIAYSHESFNHLRREAVEPIIWLLDKPTEEHWKEADVCCVRKVFLTYICKSELDDENVSQLLKLDACRIAQLATLETIHQICYIEEKPLFNADNLNFVQAIVPLVDLTKRLPTNVQESASRTLRAICWKVSGQASKSKGPKDALGILILDLPGVLDGLVSAFASPNQQSDAVAEDIAYVFGNLAYLACCEGSTAAHISERILNEKGVLEGLVKCLYEHKKPGLQRAAAGALANLAGTSNDTLMLRVANQDGALEALVTLLFAHDKPGVQEEATRAIENLAARSDDTLRLKVANQDRALEGLVMLLSAHGRPGVQEEATRVIANLTAMSNKTLKLQVANQDGALEGLVTLLSAHDKPSVQEKATTAIANLAATSDDTLRLRMANQDGALEGMVRLLSAYDKPGVQEEATRAIENLAATSDDTLRLRVANQDQALESLVTLLSAHDKPGVQEKATIAIANLTRGSNNTLKLQVANQDRALEGLVMLLSAHDKPGVQEAATKAIANLAGGSDNTLKLQVANQDGAFEGLVTLLSANDMPGVQGEATRAISNLADTSDNTLKLWVTYQDQALEGLVTLLSAHDKPDLQVEAARVLARLADTGDNARNLEEAKALLRGTNGLLEGLSSLVENGALPSVPFWGAFALTFISPTLGKGATLASGEAYKGRAHAFIRMGMYVEGLADLDQAVNLLKGMDWRALSERSFVKAKLEDFQGALDDANEAVKVNNSDQKPFTLQERGVLKRIMGDLEGALADLDEGLKLETDDYELLKHRGYVKFLLKDEEGARANADWAIRIKPPRVDRYNYGRDGCLGTDPVEYLGYKLK